MWGGGKYIQASLIAEKEIKYLFGKGWDREKGRSDARDTSG